MEHRVESRHEHPPFIQIPLGEAVCIDQVSHLQAVLLGALQGNGPVRLEGGGVLRVDGAGMQVLAAFAKTARAQGVEWRWAGISDPLREAARILGLTAYLEIPPSP